MGKRNPTEALENLFARVRPELKAELMEAIRKGMKDNIRQKRKKGETLTADELYNETTANPAFMEMFRRGNIVEEDIREIAEEVVESMNNPVILRVDKHGRNQLCPCGSGKKYKKCCGF